MKKGDIINGYRILEDFRVVGGMSKITFAERGGKEYFIKEFLSPKYPTPDSPGSEKIKEQKRKACDEFEKHHRAINDLIAKKVSLGGNLVYAVSFFRNGTSYYKVNEKIDTASLSVSEISALSSEQIITIACSVCQSLSILHDLNIVHGDLKPDNILIKQTSPTTYSGKLIDFDDSYFSEKPPKDRDLIVGTPEYYSPELATYITDEDDEVEGNTLTLASDVFTLGIIFCEYFTGCKPINDSSLPTYEAVKKGFTLKFAKSIDTRIEGLLRSMLSPKAEDRPIIRKAQNTLREIRNSKPAPPEEHPVLRGHGISKKIEIETPSHPEPPKVGLKGKGLNIADK